MPIMHALRTILGFEPLVLYGSGTNEEMVKKVIVEKYRGWDICYYFGKNYRHYSTASEFSSVSLMMAGAYDHSEWIGNGIYVGASNDAASCSISYWIRIFINRIDMEFENSPAKVKTKFDKVITYIKRDIDEYIRSRDTHESRRKIQKATKEKNQLELQRAIRGEGD